MKKLCPLVFGFVCVAAFSVSAIDLKQSKLTQVVNDVQIISPSANTKKTAEVNDIFTMPDVLRTGAASRAELIAQDQTVTRVGANTIFSFDPANRSIDLQQGSLLFHSPHGKGGGTIHTGSATASVLGTTLIVVTTPSGGFKVIDLEGKVEVNFLNGLKQSLDPGQMTFILPGGNQLAPIIFFRLDQLTQNSLLIKGFNQSLSSLPLIQDQINKQLKLIKSGKANDTGLVVGDNANSHQVEVLDPNTLQGEFNPPTHNSQQRELTLDSDATINQSSLEDASIPTPPDHVFVDRHFSLPDNNYFNGQSFIGFAARNIFINTEGGGIETESRVTPKEVDENGLSVDLSPYADQPEFDLVAAKNIQIEGSVSFDGLSDANSFSLIAGEQMLFAPGISVDADAHDFNLLAAQSMNLDSVVLENFLGNLTLNSGGDISISDGSFLDATASLKIYAQNNIAISDSTLSGENSLISSLSGFISLNDVSLQNDEQATFVTSGGINFSDSDLETGFIALNAGGSSSVSIQDSWLNAYGSSDADGSIVISAQNNIGIQDSDLMAVGGSSSITLNSQAGSVNINDSSIAAENNSESSSPEIQNVNANAASSGTSVSISAPNSINIQNSSLVADSDGGAVTLNSGGSTSVTGTSIQAQYLTINSGDGILLDGNGGFETSTVRKNSVRKNGKVQQKFIASASVKNHLQTVRKNGEAQQPPGIGSANLTAVNLATVNNYDFSSYAEVNMAAHTINLFDVELGSGKVVLRSLNGVLAPDPNKNVASVPGDVNFLYNVTRNGNPAENYVNNGGGITVTTLK